MSNLAMPVLRDLALAAHAPGAEDKDDYRIACAVDKVLLGKSRSNTLTALIPLTPAAVTVSRRGGGFSLRAANCVAFSFEGRRWEQAVAILECTEPQLVEAFVVLVIDLARRLESADGEVSWPEIVRWVEEWQMLLGWRRMLTTEEQVGLWGELWLLAKTSRPDLLLQGWRGPDQSSVDFFYDGVGLEIKTSQRAHVHHVSQRQLESPVGTHSSYLLSMWIGPDPIGGISLDELVRSLLSKVDDAPLLLKRLGSVGYSMPDSTQYSMRFIVLDAPCWFRAEDVPRIRLADAGISDLRYIVALETDCSVRSETSRKLWLHFCHTEPSFEPRRALSS